MCVRGIIGIVISWHCNDLPLELTHIVTLLSGVGIGYWTIHSLCVNPLVLICYCVKWLDPTVTGDILMTVLGGQPGCGGRGWRRSNISRIQPYRNGQCQPRPGRMLILKAGVNRLAWPLSAYWPAWYVNCRRRRVLTLWQWQWWCVPLLTRTSITSSDPLLFN